jgi:hypothetical protein
MVSWPGENASNTFSEAIVVIYGGLVARTEPIKLENYHGVELLKVYFQQFQMDRMIWQYNMTTSHYLIYLGLVNVTPRYNHAAVAMSDVQNLSRAMVVFGGQSLNTKNSTIDFLADLLLYDPILDNHRVLAVTGKTPGPRASPGATVFEHRYMVIFGGSTMKRCHLQNQVCVPSTTDLYISLNDAWLIDMTQSKLQWQELIQNRQMTPRFGGGLVSIGGLLWVGGGSIINETLSSFSLKDNLVEGDDVWLGKVNLTFPTKPTVNWSKVRIRC